MAPRTDFPPIRACLFDMDGLLLDTEDKYTICTNAMLARYGKGPLPWSIKAQLQGRTGPAAGDILHTWAQLPIPREQYNKEQTALQKEIFPSCKPLPGVEALLGDLVTAKTTNGSPVHIALATSSGKYNFELKTSHLKPLFSAFEGHRRVLGDDERIPQGRGKPAPDIYLLALETINKSLSSAERDISPEECLVFEDSVPGIEAGRRAGMRVVWVPHPELHTLFKDRQKEVLAGRANSGVDKPLVGEGKDGDGEKRGEVDDGWGEFLENLVDFPYEKWGIVVAKS